MSFNEIRFKEQVSRFSWPLRIRFVFFLPFLVLLFNLNSIGGEVAKVRKPVGASSQRGKKAGKSSAKSAFQDFF
jgi:hypothetical protein